MEEVSKTRWSGREFDFDTRNVFGFDAPEKYTCSINAYDAERNRLSVSVNGSNGCLLIFTGMRYFEGPFYWKGANFCTGSAEATTRLVHLLASPEFLDEDALNAIRPFSSDFTPRLFVVETVNFSVKIIASTAFQYYKSVSIWGTAQT